MAGLEKWVSRSACVGHDPELWFPAAVWSAEALAAVKVCQGCPVISDCLRFAQESRQRTGIWGGVVFGVSRDALARRIMAAPRR